MRKSHLAVRLFALLVIVCLNASLLAQRSDRGIITGIVTDSSGSSVPGATVKVRNEGTGVETILTTNSAGSYTTPPLVLGTYSVIVDHTGFKTSANSGIGLLGAETIRKDVALAVGAVTETVEVKGDVETLNTTTADVSHTVDENYYKALPVVMGADVRLAESVLQMQPGYLPMKPNGDPMFRGSQFNSRINGGQTRATENFFDGAAFGYASGHQQSQESAPSVEAVQEVKVITTTYAAQYGHTSGGFIEYTSKSGTNALHGSAYEYFGNDALNAAGFFGTAGKTPYRNNNFGFTLGGPVVIPKVYDGHNKTHFFVNIDWTRFRSGVLPGFGNTTPTDLMKQGNFSELLDTSTVLGKDAKGRPIYKGEIFNPGTTTTLNGVPIRDGYGFDPTTGLPIPGQANIIPAGDPNLSVVASRIAALMVHPDRPGTAFNVAGNPAGDQTWIMNARNIMFRVDQSLTPNFRMHESFYWNTRPTIRNCGEVAGCVTQSDGATSPEKNTNYYGNGFYQRIATHHANVQFDWIINTNLLNHTTIAWDRWFMGGNPLSAGVGWPSKLWAGTASPQGGILDNTAGPPLIDFQGTIPYNSIGTYGWPNFGFETNNRWQFSDDLSWQRGKHTIKVGFEYRWHQFPHVGWGVGDVGGHFVFNNLETAGYDKNGNVLPGDTGNSFASMLLGQVHNSDQTIPVHPAFHESYYAPWINDEWKVNTRLTLTLGLRWDYQSARTEMNNKYSTFDPNTPNPGAGGIPGAMIFAGSGPGRAGTRTFEDPGIDNFGPRFGFAYRAGDKTAIRGGYGIYYSGVSFSQFVGDPTIGFSSNPFIQTPNNGQNPAFLLDQGFPQSIIKFPPFIDPTIANGTGPVAVAKNDLTLPRYQNWSVTVEREITNNMRVDVSYIGNRGTRLSDHWQRMGLLANMNSPAILGLGETTLNSSCDASVIAASPNGLCPGNVPLPYASFTGNVAQALRPFPQYQNINWRGVPLGASLYNALEVVLERRFSQGLQFRVGYTRSHLVNNGAESAQGDEGINGNVQNPINTSEWSVSADDTPNVFLVAFNWEVPGAKHFKGAAGAVLGGWNLSGILRYESGRPLNIFMNNDLAGFLFNGQKRPNRVKDTGGVASRSGNFNPATQNYFVNSAWADPGALQLGNAPRRDDSVRGFPTYSEDLNIFKVFPIREQLKMKFEAQFGNLFNRTDFCDPDTNFSNGSFGTVNTQCNSPRSIQFALRFDF
jgi:carboxypeptidase family protein/TonB-dependent receptor-like protein